MHSRSVFKALLLVLCIPAVLAFFSFEGQDSLPPLPSPTTLRTSPQVTRADFVGAEACASCHRRQYDAWKRSTHGRAGGEASQATVIAPFNAEPIRMKDAIVIPLVSANGEYVFVIQQQERAEQRFRVDGVIGGGHMMGGGTQAFFTRFADGTMRMLPFEYARQQGLWFTNTGAKGRRGWIPITEDLALSDCVDWPPSRVLGADARYSNCQECHGSQIQLEFNVRAKRYETSFASLGINCESCHGPGKRHVELARSGAMAASADIGLRSLGTLTKDESLAVCFQCHALKDVVKPGYLPGKPFDEHYALKFPFLGDNPYTFDGRVRSFAYQEGHLFSDCYLNGSMTCVSCHDPHSQTYRDVRKRPLDGPFDDRQCTGCHASKAVDVEVHTKHPAHSEASRCVTCHMPYLQHPEVKKAIRFARSDHTIAIPRPRYDASWDIENACARCHPQRTVEQLEGTIRQWYGEVKPQHTMVSALVRSQYVAAPDSAAALLLRPSARHPMAQFMGLAMIIEKHLRPDMPKFDRAMRDSLVLLASHQDADVQGLALAALHLAGGLDGSTRSVLIDALKGLGGREAAVRARWALALGYLADSYRARGDLVEAITTYGKALEVQPEDARIVTSFAQAYADAGELPRAVQEYRRSLRLDPNQPLTLVNLGIAHAAQEQWSDALSAYESAMHINPHEPLAYFNAGNAYLQQGHARKAVDFYRQTIERDPGLALAHFYLARSYMVLGEYPRALESVVRALELEPTRESARHMRRDLERLLQR
jgi:tetratricopeptide (TPR) repeat protein